MVKHKKMNTKLVRALIIFIVIAALVVVGFLFVKNTYFIEDQSEPEAKVNFKELSTKINASQEASVETVVDGYGQQYEDAVKSLQEAETAKWDSEAVDKAHFSLIYASRVGDFSQVEGLYYQINAAKEDGVDVDANAAGLTQADRDKLMSQVPKVEYLQGSENE